MDEDWRVSVTFQGEPHAARLLESLRRRRLGEEVRGRLGEGIIVSASGSSMFLYAGTPGAADEAGRVVRGVLDEHGLPADLWVEQWHPLEQVWDRSSAGMRHDPAEERRAMHDSDQEQQRRQSLETGLPAWTVRADLPSHHDAVMLARRLGDDGTPVLRRWRHLLAGAASEDDARALQDKVRELAPPGTAVRAEASGGTGSMPWPALSFPPPT